MFWSLLSNSSTTSEGSDPPNGELRGTAASETVTDPSAEQATRVSACSRTSSSPTMSSLLAWRLSNTGYDPKVASRRSERRIAELLRPKRLLTRSARNGHDKAIEYATPTLN
jgi:hypothetical protein